MTHRSGFGPAPSGRSALNSVARASSWSMFRIAWTEGLQVARDLGRELRITNGVVELTLRVEQPFGQPDVNDRRACPPHGGEPGLHSPVHIGILAGEIAYQARGAIQRVTFQIFGVVRFDMPLTLPGRVVGRVDTSHHTKSDRHVVDVPGERTGRVEGERERDDTVPAMSPWVGLRPTTPVAAEGFRIDPPVSVPTPMTANAAATEIPVLQTTCATNVPSRAGSSSGHPASFARYLTRTPTCSPCRG